MIDIGYINCFFFTPVSNLRQNLLFFSEFCFYYSRCFCQDLSLYKRHYYRFFPISEPKEKGKEKKLLSLEGVIKLIFNIKCHPISLLLVIVHNRSLLYSAFRIGRVLLVLWHLPFFSRTSKKLKREAKEN